MLSLWEGKARPRVGQQKKNGRNSFSFFLFDGERRWLISFLLGRRCLRDRMKLSAPNIWLACSIPFRLHSGSECVSNRIYKNRCRPRISTLAYLLFSLCWFRCERQVFVKGTPSAFNKFLLEVQPPSPTFSHYLPVFSRWHSSARLFFSSPISEIKGFNHLLLSYLFIPASSLLPEAGA